MAKKIPYRMLEDDQQGHRDDGQCGNEDDAAIATAKSADAHSTQRSRKNNQANRPQHANITHAKAKRKCLSEKSYECARSQFAPEPTSTSIGTESGSALTIFAAHHFEIANTFDFGSGRFEDKFVVHLKQHPTANFSAFKLFCDAKHRKLDHVCGAALHGSVDGNALGELAHLTVGVGNVGDLATATEQGFDVAVFTAGLDGAARKVADAGVEAESTVRGMPSPRRGECPTARKVRSLSGRR